MKTSVNDRELSNGNVVSCMFYLDINVFDTLWLIHGLIVKPLFDFQTDVKAQVTTPHDSGLISEARQWRPVCTHIPHIVRKGKKMTALEKGMG